MGSSFIISLLVGTLRTSIPIILAALGQVYVHKSGTLDLSVEGTMIFSCLMSFVAAALTGSLTFALIVGGVSGICYSFIMAYLTVNLKSNQVISGTALTMLATGLSSYLYRVVFGIRSLPPVIENFKPINFGFLTNIPFIGPVLFHHNFTFYFMLILVGITWFIMNKTSYGLKIKAVGEFPRAADSKGIEVNRIRFQAILIGGLYSGFAGASMSLGYMNTYTDQMIAGRGFIAIAVVVFARWLPIRVLFAALLFGFANTLQMRLQSIGVDVPIQLLQALPYILTVVVLMGVSKYVKFPSYFTQPYSRDKK